MSEDKGMKKIILTAFSLFVIQTGVAMAYSGVYSGGFSGSQDYGAFAVLVRDDNSAVIMAYDSIDDFGFINESLNISSSGSFTHNNIEGNGTKIYGSVSGNGINGTYLGDNSGNFGGYKSSLSGQYSNLDGYYKGAFSTNCGQFGSASGFFRAIVSSDGDVFVYTQYTRSASNVIEVGSIDGGLLSLSGSYLSGRTINGANISGTVNGSGIKGTFSFSGCSGDFSGVLDYALEDMPVEVLPVVNGQCGISHNYTFFEMPASNLCVSDTSSTVTGNGPWNWRCNGSNGGTTASCSASVLTNNLQQESFVERFYQNILGRSADAGGMIHWRLIVENQSAAQVALGFFNSQEFLNTERNNMDFLYILYQTLFDRLPDDGGFYAWMDKLDKGELRSMVIYGFLKSQEFNQLSETFNVTSFSQEDEAEYQIADFVKRFYTLVLNRQPDVGGFNNWKAQLSGGSRTGGEIATGFFMSDEFTSRQTDDTTFVDIAYRAFFGREADAGGKLNWMNELSKGVSRLDVVSGFIGSQEFTNLADNYGIRAR